jgi:hypothetical protein
MTFLNLILLGGAAAVVIPIVIHLLNKNRYRTVPWGAMHLLDMTLKVSQRRLRLEQLLLLLLRCLVLAALAFCMARPVLTGASLLVGTAKTSLIILLDNSYSMDHRAAGAANFDQARDLAAKVVGELGRGSDVTVFQMAAGGAPLHDTPVTDLSRVAKELRALESGFGKADVVASLEKAAGATAKTPQSYREIIVISDFQRVSWPEKEGAARWRITSQLHKMNLPPQLTLFHVGAEGRENVSVESLDFSQTVLGVRQPVTIRASVRNFGERALPDLRVFFRVDGVERAASQIALAAGEQNQVLFTHTFDTPGSHVVEVVTDADPLKADNTYAASIPVWDHVPTLVVNGDPSPEPLRGETDYLQIALQPFQQEKAQLSDLITSTLVTPDALDEKALAGQRVLVLANVSRLSDASLRAVKDFVRDGGGLLLFPGDRVNTAWYNQELAAFGLMPTPFLALAGSRDGKTAPTRIVTQHFSHPALEFFNDARNGNLADGQLQQWFRLREPPPNDTLLNAFARLDSGDPFLVEKKFGEGRVILCAAPCDADGNNLPMRPFYLPLMQRLVTYLASTVFPPRNLEPGQPAVAFLPTDSVKKKAVITDPLGEKHEVTLIAKGSRGVFEFAKTQRPGLYVLAAPDGTTTHFVVNTNREESDLRQLPESERAAAAKAMGAELVGSVEEYKALDRRRRFGRELWQPVLWAVLGALFGEILLQQFLARRRR